MTSARSPKRTGRKRKGDLMPDDPLFAEISPLLVTLLRTFRGKDCTKARFARAAGLSSRSVRRYEAGERVPARAIRVRMAVAAGVAPPVVEALVIPTLLSLYRARTSSFQETSGLESLIDLLRIRLAGLAAKPHRPQVPPEEVDPEALWARLAAHPHPARRVLLRHGADFRQEPFAHWLRGRSEQAAAEWRLDEARELAELARQAGDTTLY